MSTNACFQEARRALSLENAWNAFASGDMGEVVRLLQINSELQTQLLQLIKDGRKQDARFSDIAYAYVDLGENCLEEGRLFRQIDNLQSKRSQELDETMQSLMQKCYSGFSGTRMIKTGQEMSKCIEVRQGVLSIDLMEMKARAIHRISFSLLKDTIELWDKHLLSNVDGCSNEFHDYFSVRLCVPELGLNLDVIGKIFSFLCDPCASNAQIDDQVWAGMKSRFYSFRLEGACMSSMFFDTGSMVSRGMR